MKKEIFKNARDLNLVVGYKEFAIGEEFDKSRVKKEYLEEFMGAVDRGDLTLESVEVEATDIKVSDEPIQLDKNIQKVGKDNDVTVYVPHEVVEPTKEELTIVTQHHMTVAKKVKEINNRETLNRLLSVARENGSPAVVKIIEKRLSEVE